jgi:hypothetical protein
MNNKMLSLFVFASCLAGQGQDIYITSLASNGRLAWTNSFTNGLFSIEWAPTLGTNNWRDNWKSLQGFWVSSPTSAVEVPMFYRVKCATNLFWPFPVGARFVFGVSNAVGNTWSEQMSCLGYVKPSAATGKEYALVEDIEAGYMGMNLLRSTDTSVFRFDSSTLVEDLEFQSGPVGTTWTNNGYEGEWTLKVSVEAIETVTVKAGTFASCYKFHKQVLNAGGGRADWFEWVCPGFGLVKWVDYWVDSSERPPIVYELQSWSSSVQ